MNPLRERIREEREILRFLSPRAFRQKRFNAKKELRPLRVVIRRSMPLKPNPKWPTVSIHLAAESLAAIEINGERPGGGNQRYCW